MLVLAPILCLIYIIIGGIKTTISSGNPEKLQHAKRTQIDPLSLQGLAEPWGESKLCGYPSEPSDLEEYKTRQPKKVSGDETVLKAIRKFNEVHGPAR